MSSHAKVIVIIVLGLSPLVGIAAAQVPGRYGVPHQRPPMQQMPNVQEFKVSGKVQGVGRGMIKLLSDQNQLWLIKIGRRTQVSVQGEVDESFLRNGMLVSASAELDKRGRVVSPVGQVTIFGQGAREGIVPGVFPKQTQGDLGEPTGGGKREEPAAQTGAMYDVVGMIGRGKRGRYVLNTGRGKVDFELAREAVVSLDVIDYGLAQPGDKIQCTGLLASDGRNLSAQASIVMIELASRVEQRGGATQKGPAATAPGGSKAQEPGAMESEKAAAEGAQPKSDDQPADEPDGPELQRP